MPRPLSFTLARLIPILFLLGTSHLAACRDITAGCCKVCGLGKKACGDECISEVQTCNSPRGCACGGY